METKTVSLKIKEVIGTGDPLDSIMLIPLITDWKMPRECVWTLKEECKNPIKRLYVLDEPIDGHKVVGCCEEHHKIFKGMDNHLPTNSRSRS